MTPLPPVSNGNCMSPMMSSLFGCGILFRSGETAGDRSLERLEIILAHPEMVCTGADRDAVKYLMAIAHKWHVLTEETAQKLHLMFSWLQMPVSKLALAA